MSPKLALLLRIVAIAAVIGGLVFFVRRIDLDSLGSALRSAKLWPLALVGLLSFVCLFGKSLSWRILFAPRYRVPTLRLFRYTIAAFAASAIAPARAGEVLRVWVLKKRDGVPGATTAGVAVAEKVLDALTLLVLVAPVPWLLPGLPPWIAKGILIAAGGSVALFIALYIAAGRVAPTDKTTMLRRFLGGMHALRDPRRLLAAFLVLGLVWCVDLTMVMLSLYAVGVELPIAAGLLILFTLCLAITLPSTPAQIGAHQVGAMIALELLQVQREAALAFALLYHAMQVLPWLAAGLLLELPLVLGRVAKDTDPDDPDDASGADRDDHAPRDPAAGGQPAGTTSTARARDNR